MLDDEDEILLIGSSSVSFDLTQRGIQARTTIYIDDTPISTNTRFNVGIKRSPRADLSRETKRRRLPVDKPRRQKEIISISSDEDENPIPSLPSTSRAQSTMPLKRSSSPLITSLVGLPVPTSKRSKLDVDTKDLNSEEEDEEAYESMWADVKYRSDNEAPRQGLTEEMNSLHLEHSPPPQKKHTIRMTGRHFQPQNESSDSDEDGPVFPWVGLDAMHPLKKPKRRIPPSQFHNRTYSLFAINSNLKKTTIKYSSGPVAKFAQKRGDIAIASCVTGGGPDIPDEEPNHYNKSGSLVVWEGSSSTPLILPWHVISRKKRNADSWTKHYSVNDVQFEPHGTALVSAGNDQQVHISHHWNVRPRHSNYSEEQLEEVQEEVETDSPRKPFDLPPTQLLFKPDPRETVLAIAEKDVTLWSNLPPSSFTTTSFRMSREQGERALCMLWGQGPTSNCLFASSESERHDVWKGSHGCFDINSDRPYFLEASRDSGDAMALHPDGRTLALFTSTRTSNTLRLYDVSTKQRYAHTTIPLASFKFPTPREGEGEPEGAVTKAVYSPDGVYLAVGRNDNRTHVYDLRMLQTRGGSPIIHEFEHTGKSLVLPGEKSYGYGVTGVEWVQSPCGWRLGLVTGGNDGCVRLWSLSPPRGNLENGRILLEADADISCLSVGDRFMGEHELVVGDSTGQVYICDGLNMNLQV